MTRPLMSMQRRPRGMRIRDSMASSAMPCGILETAWPKPMLARRGWRLLMTRPLMSMQRGFFPRNANLFFYFI